jgi:hypothetical protein
MCQSLFNGYMYFTPKSPAMQAGGLAYGRPNQAANQHYSQLKYSLQFADFTKPRCNLQMW